MSEGTENPTGAVEFRQEVVVRSSGTAPGQDGPAGLVEVVLAPSGRAAPAFVGTMMLEAPTKLGIRPGQRGTVTLRLEPEL